MLRFAGFELDRQRAELRGPGAVPIRLRPKTFDLLWQLASNPGRVLGKDELMAAVWPDVVVSEDSLFQCVRELRLALGDEQRQLIKVVSGRGYRFDADVTSPDAPVPAAPPAEPAMPAPRRWPGVGRRGALITAAIVVVALVAAVFILRPDFIFRRTQTVAVMSIAVSSGEPAAVRLATGVTNRLSDGLAKIVNLRVLSPSAGPGQADLVISGEVSQTGGIWTVEARLTNAVTNQVEWTQSVSLDAAAVPDLPTQESRIAAGLGYDLALHLSEMGGANSGASDASKVLIEQATAYMNQTSIERFQAAQKMLEDGLAADPDNPDLQAALAAVLLRGVQMVWYPAEDRPAARERAGELLAAALKGKPNSVPVQEANCRFLATTNQFNEALVTCARTLDYDPWDGIALYHLGLSQMYLGRFDKSVVTFRQADQFDTPEVSRWTWKIGLGWVYLLMNRPADALPWLERTIAITPASGRVYLLLAAAHYQLGHPEEAAAAMAKCLELRPGSTAKNIGVPLENTSPVFAAASERLTQIGVAAGLPPG